MHNYVVGGFAAGWPFTVVVERYGWSMAYAAVELGLLVMSGVCCYLVYLLVSGMKKLKQN